MNRSSREKPEGGNPLGGSSEKPKAPYGMNWKYALQLYRLQNFLDEHVFPLLVCVLALFKRPGPLPSSPHRLLVIRFSGLGDAVASLPMMERFQKAYPRAQLDVLCIPRNAAAFYHQSFIHEIHVLDRKGLLLNLPFFLLSHWRAYDICIDTEHGFRLAAILSFFLSRRTIGFHYNPGHRLYDASVDSVPGLHGVPNLMRLLGPLGVSVAPPRKLLSLHYGEADRHAVDALFQKYGIRPSRDLLIGIHPFAAPTSVWRTWPPERVAELIGKLRQRYRCKIILTGQHSDSTPIPKLLAMLPDKTGVFDFSDLPTPGLFYLISTYRALVTIDSGPMHIAAAQGVTAFALFGPKPPTLTGPWPPQAHYTFHHVPPGCSHTSLDEVWSCHCRDEYVRRITVEEVLGKIKGYLK